MKLKIRTKVGEHERIFEIPCGEGDKSFKWLSNCATQRFALSGPNGTLRRKDLIRGDTFNSQALATIMTLPNGEIPHPSSLICDFLSDGDVVTIELGTFLEVDTTGSPAHSEWATLAYATSTFGGQSSAMGSDSADEETVVDDNESEKNGKVLFMRSILNSQATNKTKVKDDIEDRWEYVEKLMPKLPQDVVSDIKDVFSLRWPIIVEIFQNYAPLNMMMKREMTETDYFHFVEDAEIFSQRDFEFLTKRTFRRVAAGSRFLTFGGFVAAVLLLSQARHNDIFEKEKSELIDPVRAVELIIENNLLKLAKMLNVTSYLRLTLFHPKLMYELRLRHELLFLVFEKYAAKSMRDTSLTLPAEFMASLLADSKMTSEPNPTYASEILTACTTGMINGRVLLENSDFPPPPSDEFSFPEFIEGVTRACFKPDSLETMDEQTKIETAIRGKELSTCRITQKTFIVNSLTPFRTSAFETVAGLLTYKEPSVVPPVKGQRGESRASQK